MDYKEFWTKEMLETEAILTVLELMYEESVETIIDDLEKNGGVK